MKKLLLSIFAVAALFSCSKSVITYDQEQSEIGFAPVAKNITKSVAGYNGDTFDGVFPTEIYLYVFANASDDAGTAWPDPYFKNAKFKYNASKGTEATQGSPSVPTSGAYEGEHTRYWPNVKTLKFAGYSDACNVSKTNENVTMDFATNTLTINSYTQDNANYTTEGSNDLMWFPCDGTAYSKQADEIAAQMKHACSWITINVKGDDVTGAENSTWKLNSLVVTSLAHSGKVVCGSTTATWTIATDAVKTNEDYYKPTAGTLFTKEFVKYEKTANNFIVIPQTPTNLEVCYTYTSDATNNLTLTETKTVSLDFDGVANTNAEWQAGVHYIYNVTITATEILIDPYVVNWTDYDADSNTEGDQPVNIPNI